MSWLRLFLAVKRVAEKICSVMDFRFLGCLGRSLAAHARSTLLILYDLEAVGVPAFDIIAEMTGRSQNEIKNLARAGRLRSTVLFELLNTAYTMRYKGMAEKLAIKRAGKS